MEDDIKIDLTPKLNLPKHRKRRWPWIIGAVVLILALTAGGVYYFYQDGLKPVNPNQAEVINFEVAKGNGVSEIGRKLLEAGLIKNRQVFEWYNRLNKTSSSLKNGNYQLKKTMSLPEIVKILVAGKTEQMTVTFFPGSTLNFRHNDRDKTLTHREALKKVGFSDAQIDAAFTKSYSSHKFFQLLPEVKSLEGLIFGETFIYRAGASLDEVLNYNFDHFYQIIQKNDLVAKYQKHNLSLYQGIILASIVEREAITKDDRAQVAQVFLKRYQSGMKLGSDVTYQYICRMTGVPNNYNIDSPFNTRRYEGLPPTPIATPSLSALLALAEPAAGDYVYFLAGDDGKTYFAHTYAEHERNIRDYCKVGCSVQ